MSSPRCSQEGNNKFWCLSLGDDRSDARFGLDIPSGRNIDTLSILFGSIEIDYKH
jgi:hypothetical protein